MENSRVWVVFNTMWVFGIWLEHNTAREVYCGLRDTNREVAIDCMEVSEIRKMIEEENLKVL